MDASLYGNMLCTILGSVTVTLTYDLLSRIIVSEAYLYIIWGRNPKFDVWIHLGMA